MGLEFFGRQLDAAGLIRLRLGEQAVHVWDVAVTFDPAAVVAANAVPELFGHIGGLLAFVAKPAGQLPGPAARRPGAGLPADRGRPGVPVGLGAWYRGGRGGPAAQAEALLRLFYGRLDPDHTPGYTAEGIDLDRLRAVFPGF